MCACRHSSATDWPGSRRRQLLQRSSRRRQLADGFIVQPGRLPAAERHLCLAAISYGMWRLQVLKKAQLVGWVWNKLISGGPFFQGQTTGLVSEDPAAPRACLPPVGISSSSSSSSTPPIFCPIFRSP
eukprot:359118-Chlamydomonas_euryale.AAC.4